jgi:hypothetical protein
MLDPGAWEQLPAAGTRQHIPTPPSFTLTGLRGQERPRLSRDVPIWQQLKSGLDESPPASFQDGQHTSVALTVSTLALTKSNRTTPISDEKLADSKQQINPRAAVTVVHSRRCTTARLRQPFILQGCALDACDKCVAIHSLSLSDLARRPRRPQGADVPTSE